MGNVMNVVNVVNVMNVVNVVDVGNVVNVFNERGQLVARLVGFFVFGGKANNFLACNLYMLMSSRRGLALGVLCALQMPTE